MSPEDDHWQLLIQGLRAGNPHIAQEFWDQYGVLLHQVAEKHLGDRVRRRVGPEDVVQSACRTFLRRARLGEFQLPDSAALWHLLCAITLNKVRQQIRFHQRQKRGVNQEQPLEPDPGSERKFEPQALGPTPAEAAEFADQLQQLLAGLDEEERQMVDLKLQECTHEEVAAQLGCSERTVRRVMKRVQARLGRMFDLA